MYYFLNCFGPLDKDRASLKNIPQFDNVYWNMGNPIHAPLPDPIDIDLNTDEGNAMVPMFNVGILVFSKKMVETLRHLGVDNLQIFNVILHDRQIHKTYEDYLAVNIIGKIACADLSKSVYTAHGEPLCDVDFDSLVIDESKTSGQLMFRLAECVSGILVHESIKEGLQEAGIPYLDFILPEEWVG